MNADLIVNDLCQNLLFLFLKSWSLIGLSTISLCLVVKLAYCKCVSNLKKLHHSQIDFLSPIITILIIVGSP